jgi:hypothetical protein
MQVLDRNPEFNQMLSNPEVLRESMRLAANPVSLLSMVLQTLLCYLWFLLQPLAQVLAQDRM